MSTAFRAVTVVIALWATAARGQPSTEPTGAGVGARGLVITDTPARPPRMTPAMDYAQRHYVRRIAVTIGISAYGGNPWPGLDAAVTDAQHMANLFRAMGFDRVVHIADDEATRESILDVLERRLPLMAGERDLVVIFFAGHGASNAGHGYIIPRDADRDLARTAISIDRLKDSALRLRVRHTVFLIDACFSGLMLRRGAVDKVNRLAFWEAAAGDRVVQILTAGKSDELAHEADGWGQFTRAIYTGLEGAADRNGDGVVVTEELALHAEERARRDHNAQHPQWGTMEGSGTALFLDARRLPRSAQPAQARPTIPGMEASLRRIHQLMDRREWVKAEKRIRDLLIAGGGNVLRLLLAEVYIEADVLGNARLIDTELQRIADSAATDDQVRRMLDLRARLDRARRGGL